MYGSDHAAGRIPQKRATEDHAPEHGRGRVPDLVEDIAIGAVYAAVLGGKGDLAQHREPRGVVGCVPIGLDSLLQGSLGGMAHREGVLREVVKHHGGDNGLPDVPRSRQCLTHGRFDHGLEVPMGRNGRRHQIGARFTKRGWHFAHATKLYQTLGCAAGAPRKRGGGGGSGSSSSTTGETGGAA